MSDILIHWAWVTGIITGLSLVGLGAQGKLRTGRDVRDAVLGALAVTLIFAFLSGGRGCTTQRDIDNDCLPAGPGIYNTC